MEKKKRALVITRSDIILRLVRCELSPELECYMADRTATGYDYIIYDYDFCEKMDLPGISIGWGEGADITLPFPIGELRAKILSPRQELTLDRTGLIATLCGRKVRLTELEATLLDLIIRGGKEYTSRESLHRALWGERATDGALNVYIHYLRRKLELTDEKVILSSREGYKINERYL